ncbi:unnamed protein product [Cylindrotheca closterium]|uniref:Helicase-associated domain-containing protein n=1 Tax=Cylindrotheca closterium TaxID=2856 RepID=A0AAD2G8K7_9STRA|nr:unnamed protein product [Cylindrotheca closterium]
MASSSSKSTNSPSMQDERETADKTWKFRFQELLDYRKEHGNTLVPQRHQQLGTWVSAQRKLYRLLQKGRHVPQLNDWKIQQLNDIDFIWFVGRNRDKILAQLMMEGKTPEKTKAMNKRQAIPHKLFVAPKKNKKQKTCNQTTRRRKARCQTRSSITQLQKKKIHPAVDESFLVQQQCTEDEDEELNDHDLELARLIANFTTTTTTTTTTTASHDTSTNVVLDDEEEERAVTNTMMQDYQEMNNYLNTIATLHDDIFSLQQELFQIKSTTEKLQNELVLHHHSKSSNDTTIA